MSNLNNLSVAQLRQLITIKEQIEELQAELDSLVGGEVAAAPVVGRKRRMSAAGRAAIARAQRARWAKQRGAEVEAEPARKKRKVSAAAKAKMAAAARARWAAAKAAGRSTL